MSSEKGWGDTLEIISSENSHFCKRYHSCLLSLWIQRLIVKYTNCSLSLTEVVDGSFIHYPCFFLPLWVIPSGRRGIITSVPDDLGDNFRESHKLYPSITFVVSFCPKEHNCQHCERMNGWAETCWRTKARAVFR